RPERRGGPRPLPAPPLPGRRQRRRAAGGATAAGRCPPGRGRGQPGPGWPRGRARAAAGPALQDAAACAAPTPPPRGQPCRRRGGRRSSGCSWRNGGARRAELSGRGGGKEQDQPLASLRQARAPPSTGPPARRLEQRRHPLVRIVAGSGVCLTAGATGPAEGWRHSVGSRPFLLLGSHSSRCPRGRCIRRLALSVSFFPFLWPCPHLFLLCPLPSVLYAMLFSAMSPQGAVDAVQNAQRCLSTSVGISVTAAGRHAFRCTGLHLACESLALDFTHFSLSSIGTALKDIKFFPR
ncbi:unnamed protein product, partial [Prorocentrum cordatum]